MNEKMKNSFSKMNNLVKVPKHYIEFNKSKKEGDYSNMSISLKKLYPLLKKSSSYYETLSNIAFKQDKWGESLKYINKAIDNERNKVPEKLYKRKFQCLLELKVYTQLYDELVSYLKLYSYDEEILNIFYKVCIKLNCIEEAIEYKEKFLKYKIEKNEVPIKNRSYKELSELYYRLGFRQLNNSERDDASINFDKSVYYSEDDKVKEWGIAVLHEKFRNWQLAIDNYKLILEKYTEDAELYYKIGSLLKKIKKINEAIYYFENALSRDKVLSPWHYNLALCYETINDYENAEKWYKSAIARQQVHRPGNFRRLAYILYQRGKKEEALQVYNEAELYRMPSNMSKEFYEKNIKKLSVRYGINYEFYSICEKMIFYESMGGERLMGNPAGIFEYVIDNESFSDFTHVWVINDFSSIPKKLRAKDNIIFVKRNTDAYRKYIAQSKFLICDSNFTDYIVRKPNQKYLQTTHGIFYKTVGRESSGTQLGVAGSTRNLLQATHILAPNDFMVEKLKTSYSIRSIHTGKIAKMGYPRIDVTLNTTEISKKELKKRMKINNKKKIVLYAPTWRGEDKEKNSFDTQKLISDLNKLASLEVNVLFRGHTMTKNILKKVDLPKNIIIPPEDISTNELLSITDVLISDYSSVFFDFIPTERPIVHYLYDLDQYKKERGLNLSEEELPGYIAKSINGLLNAVRKGLEENQPSQQYLEAKERFCPYDQGESSRNISNWFFKKDENAVELVKQDKAKKSYLYLGGAFTDTKHLPEIVNDMNNKVTDGDNVSVMLKKIVAKDTEKLAWLKQLDKSVNLLPHAGPIPNSLIELAAIEDLKKQGIFIDDYTRQLVNKAYRREFRRLFGDTKFDEVVNFEKENSLWGNLEKVRN